jgi:hypothetical protein
LLVTQEALKMLHSTDESNAFDVVIMDVNMQLAGGVMRGDEVWKMTTSYAIGFKCWTLYHPNPLLK